MSAYLSDTCFNNLGIKGHTTITCPHRVATEFGVVPAPPRNVHNSLEFVFERQLRPRIPKVSLLLSPNYS